MLWIFAFGAFLAGLFLGRWAFVVLIPLLVGIRIGPLEESIQVWIMFVLTAVLTLGIVVRWFAKRRRVL